MVPVEQIAVPLASVLASALLVERIIEGGKNVVDILPKPAPNVALLPADEAERPLRELVGRHEAAELRDEAETGAEAAAGDIARLKARIAELEAGPGAKSDPTVAAQLVETARELGARSKRQAQTAEWDEQVPVSKVLVADATDADDGATARVLVLQLFAAATGIVVAHYAKLNLFGPLLSGGMPAELDYLLTGLLIGGGSAPVHLLIRFVSERRCPVEIEEAAARPETEATPVVEVMAPAPPRPETDPSSWVEIPYEGGIDSDVLEGIHHRGQDPTMIVYHHTAMRHTASMEDLVRVIKERTDAHGNHWVTGYHCVILGDATIAPFCRWDRYGNHAAGYNRQSLGLTFMGNFETDPRVPFSNPDGRYGPSRPTEAQLVSGARVAALWTLLYDIPLDFDKQIIPHRQISSKTCPGGNFPYAAFRDLVRDFHTRWKQDPVAQERIRQFALKPYLFQGPRQRALRRVS